MKKNTTELWNSYWEKSPRSTREDKFNHILLENSIIWQRIEAIVSEHFGSFDGLKVLEIGCDTGSWSRALAQKARSRQLFGIEVVPDRASIASQNGVQVTMADITNGLPYADASFDIIHANQVIEHLSDLDLFMAEIYRVLKKGGYVILSTENGSSWHNIFAAVMGWQIFSLTNMSDRSAGIGNPLAVHRHNTGHMKSWTHKTIFNFRGLVEFVGAHGFSDIKVSGAGYYPFPACFGKIDKRHAHFITIRGTK